MPEKTYKRTYFLPKKLMDFFAEWCRPGRDYSPKVAGAILYFMALPADIREFCEQAAYEDDIKNGLKAIKEKFIASSDNELFERRFQAAFDEFLRREEQSRSSYQKKPGRKNSPKDRPSAG